MQSEDLKDYERFLCKMPLLQSSTELKCFKGLVYFYVVLLSVSVCLQICAEASANDLQLQGDQVGFTATCNLNSQCD